jgi:hypothetical protein
MNRISHPSLRPRGTDLTRLALIPRKSRFSSSYSESLVIPLGPVFSLTVNLPKLKQRSSAITPRLLEWFASSWRAQTPGLGGWRKARFAIQFHVHDLIFVDRCLHNWAQQCPILRFRWAWQAWYTITVTVSQAWSLSGLFTPVHD